MDELPRLGKRELICLLLFTCNYVVSVWRGFFFLWVLGMGYVIFIVALPEPSIYLFNPIELQCYIPVVRTKIVDPSGAKNNIHKKEDWLDCTVSDN